MRSSNYSYGLLILVTVYKAIILGECKDIAEERNNGNVPVLSVLEITSNTVFIRRSRRPLDDVN